MSYEQALAASLSTQAAATEEITTLELHHPDYTDADGEILPVRLTSCAAPLAATLERCTVQDAGSRVTFAPARYSFAAPKLHQRLEHVPVSLRLENMSPELAELMLLAQASPHQLTVLLRSIRLGASASSLEPAIALAVVGIELALLSVEAFVSCRLPMQDAPRFPGRLYSEAHFPALSSSYGWTQQ